MMRVVCANVYIVWICVSLCNSEDLKTLRMLGFLPMTGEKGWVGGGACLPAVMMAIRDVHAYEGLLDGYNLTYNWIDTKCDPGLAVYKMSNSLHKDPPYVMLLGAGCSTESTTTAQVSNHWNLTQISYGSSSPILSDRVRFPRFFRLAGPDQKINPSRIAMMRNFNWKKVATINQAMEFFSVVIDDFVRSVQGTDITIISQEIFENDPMTRVKNLQNHDARIIITACYEDKARKILCAAYKLGHYGPKIIWMFVRWYSKYFWRSNLIEEDVGCTAEQMDIVAEGSFVSGFYYRNPIVERGIANMTADEFDEQFLNDPMYDPTTAHMNFIGGPCYDHVWASALALNCTDARLKQKGHPKSLDEFTYTDSDIGDVIFECMGNLSMVGVSGNIAFKTGADPSKNVKIERIQGGEREHVGLYRMDTNPRQFEWKEDAIKWKGGNIPRDSTYIIRKEVIIPASLYISMSILAGAGLALAAGFLTFNVVNRNNKIVKLSSPNINNVLLLGCVLCYSTVFMKTTETDSAALCQARIFCFALGFTIAFGALFSKTWRVYRIFTNKKLLKRTIKDVQLLAIIGGMVAVVMTILVVWEIVGPHKMYIKNLHKENFVLGNDEEIHPFVRMCHSDFSSYFAWGLYLIEGALLAFGAFLAWETRHVKIEALNDSHQIGLCLYNVVVLSAVGLTLSLLLDDQVVMMYGITSGCLIIGTTITQTVVFIPKIRDVYNKNSVAASSNGSSAGRLAFNSPKTGTSPLPPSNATTRKTATTDDGMC